MNLFVGNLSMETTEDDLRRIFSEFGEIVSVKILKDNDTGQSRGFGFVEMADKYNGFDAIDNIDSTFLLGNIISVKEAKAKQKTNDRGGNRRPFRPRSGGGDRDNREGREPRERFRRRF